MLSLVLLTAWSGHVRTHGMAPAGEAALRIVSLAPSITETLFALRLGEQVVGVTSYCAYPPEARHKAQVAGFSEAYYEAIARQRPTLVIVPRDKERIQRDLIRLGFHILPVETRTLDGFLQSIDEIGRATGSEQAAAQLGHRVRDSFAQARTRAGQGPLPRVLLCVMQEESRQGRISHVTAIGKDGFYDAILRAASGENAYTGEVPYPRLSGEALAQLNPDVIIDIAPHEADVPALAQAWQNFTGLKAVRDKRVHILTDTAYTVPGPRAAHTVGVLADLLHPLSQAPAKANAHDYRQ